jgi:hypothetical protein
MSKVDDDFALGILIKIRHIHHEVSAPILFSLGLFLMINMRARIKSERRKFVVFPG